MNKKIIKQMLSDLWGNVKTNAVYFSGAGVIIFISFGIPIGAYLLLEKWFGKEVAVVSLTGLVVVLFVITLIAKIRESYLQAKREVFRKESREKRY